MEEMKVLTSSEMRKIDEYSIKNLGIPGCVLMENAGVGIMDIFKKLFIEVEGIYVTILCGKGNNGGDGFVLARHLLNHGAGVSVFLLGNKSEIKGDAKINFSVAEKIKVSIVELENSKSLIKLKKSLLDSDVVVDAIFGTGFKGSVKGIAKEVIEMTNEFAPFVISIDCPSGLDCDNGQIGGKCIQADLTATMALMKRGLLLYPGRNYAGEIHVIDIGIPSDLANKFNIKVSLLNGENIKVLFPERKRDAHKGDFGSVFVLAGSVGMTGAASMTALSAQRAGAGLVTLGIPESLNEILEVKLTEVMTKPLPETNEKSISLNAENIIGLFLRNSDVLALGPGLSLHPETIEVVHRIVSGIEIPLVIDADGLNALALKPKILKKSSRDANIVLTPHPGEMARLLGCRVEDIQKDRVSSAQKAANLFNSVVVLKGAPTIISEPDGTSWINSTGNPGMATGGSGDILCGLIAGFIAQGFTPSEAARVGVYLHGLAGDIAAMEKTEYGMIASDILEKIPEAMRRIQNQSEEKEKLY